jgi:hypothetical protein
MTCHPHYWHQEGLVLGRSTLVKAILTDKETIFLHWRSKRTLICTLKLPLSTVLNSRILPTITCHCHYQHQEGVILGRDTWVKAILTDKETIFYHCQWTSTLICTPKLPLLIVLNLRILPAITCHRHYWQQEGVVLGRWAKKLSSTIGGRREHLFALQKYHYNQSNSIARANT